MTARTVDIRHVRATRESRRLSEAFFLANPHRRHWVRPSMPFESGKGETGHLAAPITIVQLTDRGDLRKFTLAGNLDTVPNDERFLSLLVAHIDAQSSDTPKLPHEVHAALLELAGYEVRRG